MMLEINTIADYEALPPAYREDLLKAIRAKDRLDEFLQTRLRTKPPQFDPYWTPCPKCSSGEHPGYILKEPPKQRDNSDIHPSQIDKCLRYSYYVCSGYAEDIEKRNDARGERIFDLGHAWHEVMQKWYGRQGAWCSPEHYHDEVPFDPDAVLFDGTPATPVANHFWLKGSVDAIVSRYEIPFVNGLGPVAIRLVHEYKTMKTSEYEKLTRPKPEHKKQATIYSAVFNVPIVVYFYLNKDNSQMADFPVPFDYSIWADITKQCQTIQYYVNDGAPPSWEATSAVLNPRECESCGLRKVCQPPLKQLSGRS
jgi:CRISPR/Cas system-associated exonuclease Cas4 (RecB family)